MAQREAGKRVQLYEVRSSCIFDPATGWLPALITVFTETCESRNKTLYNYYQRAIIADCDDP